MLREECTDYVLDLEQPTPSSQMWDTVPVEVEKSPEGQLQQQMAATDGLRKYDYIAFLVALALDPER